MDADGTPREAAVRKAVMKCRGPRATRAQRLREGRRGKCSASLCTTLPSCKSVDVYLGALRKDVCLSRFSQPPDSRWGTPKRLTMRYRPKKGFTQSRVCIGGILPLHSHQIVLPMHRVGPEHSCSSLRTRKERIRSLLGLWLTCLKHAMLSNRRVTLGATLNMPHLVRSSAKESTLG